MSALATYSSIDGLACIRRGTRQLHQRLDRQSPMAALVDPECCAKTYRQVVMPLIETYAAVDRALQNHDRYRPQAIAPYSPRARRLARPFANSIEWPSDDKLAFLNIDSTASYLGGRYVVDGAQFGQRMIARALIHSPAQRELGMELSRFWRHTFVSTEHWRALCYRLELIHTRNEIASAVRMARYVFRLFLDRFERAKIARANE